LTFGQLLSRLCHLLRLVVEHCSKLCQHLDSFHIKLYPTVGCMGFELTNEVAVLEIEAIQLVASLLCVHDIFVHYKGCSLCSIDVPLPYLPTIVVSGSLP
jgi:hypothetical protein